MATASDTVAMAQAPSAVSYDRLAGMALVALLPALFWTVVYAVVAGGLGFAVTSAGLAAVGSAIALFLLTVFGALVPRGR